MQNKISIEITPQEETALTKKVGELRELLPPGLITLTESERKSMPKMGDKSVAFTEKAIDLASQNPNLLPSYVDINEARKDFNTYVALSHIIHALEPVMGLLNDSSQLSGSEAYMSGLSIYNLSKDAEHHGVPGAKEAANAMGERFPGRGAAKPKEDTPK